jgi:hypothetical protein
MNFVALRMLTGDRAKYLGLVFAIAFCTFLLENQTSIFAGILKRTGSQIADVTDAEVWVMDPQTQYFRGDEGAQGHGSRPRAERAGCPLGSAALQGRACGEGAVRKICTVGGARPR